MLGERYDLMFEKHDLFACITFFALYYALYVELCFVLCQKWYILFCYIMLFLFEVEKSIGATSGKPFKMYVKLIHIYSDFMTLLKYLV